MGYELVFYVGPRDGILSGLINDRIDFYRFLIERGEIELANMLAPLCEQGDVYLPTFAAKMTESKEAELAHADLQWIYIADFCRDSDVVNINGQLEIRKRTRRQGILGEKAGNMSVNAITCLEMYLGDRNVQLGALADYFKYIFAGRVDLGNGKSLSVGGNTRTLFLTSSEAVELSNLVDSIATIIPRNCQEDDPDDLDGVEWAYDYTRNTFQLAVSQGGGLIGKVSD